MLKNRKGISLTTAVITVMILLVIMGTLVYSALDSVKIRKLNNLYSDLRQIDDAVGIYYLKYGKLPIKNDASHSTITASKNDERATLETNKIDFILKDNVNKLADKNSLINPNDYFSTSATYEYIDLSLLNNISLYYPDNEFIVNTRSHTVYNLTGIKLDGKTYHSLPLNYKDTQYNEEHPVNSITLKNVAGIVSGTKVYFATDTKSINLKDLLKFNYTGTDGSGKPKSVVFNKTDGFNTSILTLDSKTGVVGLKNENATSFPTDDMPVVVSVTNYNGTNKSVTININLSYINVVKQLESEAQNIDKVNLIATETQSTYKYLKTTTEGEEYKLQSSGVLVSNFNATTKSENSEIATATYTNLGASGNKIVFKSGEKAGSTKIDFITTEKGLAKDSVIVNVYDYKIYSGSAGSNTNISKIDLTGLGDSSSTNLKLNVEGPDGFTANNDNVEWSIVNGSGDLDTTSNIVNLTTSGTTATLKPLKPGKTYLQCIFKVDGEMLGKSIIPVNVSGIETDDGTAVTNDTITLSKSGTKTVKLKYTFADSSLGASAIYENPKITPTTNFTASKDSSNVFTIKYTGTSDVTATVTIKVKVGDKEYIDTITIKIA